MHNLQIHEQGSTIQERPSSVGLLQPYSKSNEGISCTSLRCSVLTRFNVKIFFLRVAECKKTKKILPMCENVRLLGLINCDNLVADCLVARHSASQERSADNQVIRSLDD